MEWNIQMRLMGRHWRDHVMDLMNGICGVGEGEGGRGRERGR